MKLCFLAAADSIHSIRWLRYFLETGNEITWITFTPPLPEAKDLIAHCNFHYVHLSKGITSLLELPLAVLKIRALIKRQAPDVLHAHYAGLYGLMGALLRYHPYVISVWGSDVLIFPSTNLKKKITTFILKHAELITLDGYNTRAAVINFGIPEEKIKFIQFGVDTEKFMPKNIRQSNTIISIRSLEPIYDIETLIRAVPWVATKIPQTKFLIAGDGSEKKRLVKLAEDLGVTKNIQFVGRVPHDKLPDFYNQASVYVSTSLSDSGISMSTAEAMACGLPVIVTDTSDNIRWVENYKGGFVIPIKSPELLAEKIIYLLEHEMEIKSYGEINRRTIEERNSYMGEMAKMRVLYKNLIN